MEKLRSLYKTHGNRLFKILFGIAFSAFCIAVLYSYVTVPFTGDIQVFMAAANQVKYQDSRGIMAIFEAWELKGIGNRILMWLIYIVADFLVGYERKIAFAYMAKLVYAVFAILIMGVTAHLWPAKDIRRKRYSFFAMFLAVFATFTSVQMQAEMSCVIISLFCTACILHGKKWSLVTGGILGATLIFYKSIFVLFYIVILLGALMYDAEAYEKKKNYWIAIASMVVAEIALVMLVYIAYPQEFVDMQLSASLQSTLFSSGSDVKLPNIINAFVNQLTMTSIAIPLLIAAAAAAILLAFLFYKHKDYGRIGLLIILWLIPIDLIVVSNMYFQYHYYMLMLPGLISIITFLKYEDISDMAVFSAAILGMVVVLANRILHIVNPSLVMMVLVNVLILALITGFATENRTIRSLFHVLTMAVCIFFWCNYSSCISYKYNNLVDLQMQSVSICDSAFPSDFGDEPVLFLDSGSASFYADAPSYSRYFFNLPMQRWNPEKNWAVQIEEYEKMMTYDGKYIVYTPWFGLRKYPDLLAKIDSEYEVLANSGLYFHSPEWNLFMSVNAPDVSKIDMNESCFVYVRKNAQ